MSRTTIKDVARAAGVSTTTVSHALNGTRYVSPTTRDRIRALAEQLDYHPDPIARALQGQDTLLIGHIITDLFGNSFFARVSCGADRRAQELGYATILAYTGEHAEHERKAVQLLVEKRVNGIIFDVPQAAESVALAVSAGVAAVMIERPWPVPGAHAVVSDHRRALHDLTQLLIEQGHRRIAFIGGDFARSGSAIVERRRLQGFRDALREAGLEVPASHIVLVAYGREPARAACARVLDDGVRPSALVVGSDLLSAGVLQDLYERHLRIPDDISVVSFDDMLGPDLSPPLTEAEPPMEEMGRQAVDLIAKQCRRPQGQRGRGQRIVLQARIHRRASTQYVSARATGTVAPLSDGHAAEGRPEIPGGMTHPCAPIAPDTRPPAHR